MGWLDELLGGTTRSAVAGGIGAPVDAAALGLNALIAGGGYAGHKLGLLQTPPELIENPVGGSEWIAGKMRGMGLLNDNPGSTADNWGNALGSVLVPLTAAKAPQIARGLLQMEANAMAPTQLSRQAGVARLPFLDDAERAYAQGIPSVATDSRGNQWRVNVGNDIDGVRFKRDGVVMGVNRNPSQQYYADSGHRDVANQIYRLQDEKRAARSLNAELMAPQPAQPIPQWAAELTGAGNTRAAGADWWNSALKSKSNASFDAFADAAKDTPLMYYGKGSASNAPSDVAAAYPGISAKQSGGDLLFSGKNGGLMVFGADTATPVIRSTGAGSKGKVDGGGKELYQAAYNWAGNNGKVIAPDSGITPINELRKLGNVLSAQIRSGKPVAELNSGGLLGEQGIPQIWQAEAKMAAKRAPEIKSLKFDGTGFSLSDKDLLKKLSDKDPSFERGVGVMTAKRAALAEWLKTATPVQAKAAAAALAAGGSGAVFANAKD